MTPLLVYGALLTIMALVGALAAYDNHRKGGKR
jgi:hypothetical protein